ncbi:MAG: hypothetical protein ACT4O4_06950 [Nitrospiraceae bacterium]
MNKLFAVSMAAGTALLVEALPAMANTPAAEGPSDYSGITGMYYVLIGLVLAYGIYDTFLKKS